SGDGGRVVDRRLQGGRWPALPALDRAAAEGGSRRRDDRLRAHRARRRARRRPVRHAGAGRRRGGRAVKRAAAALFAAGLAAAPAAAQRLALTTDSFGGLTARSLGPAVMSGRIAAIDAVAGDPLTIWVGAASGGVWKSADGGTTFKPVFDRHTQSIGALRV